MYKDKKTKENEQIDCLIAFTIICFVLFIGYVIIKNLFL